MNNYKILGWVGGKVKQWQSTKTTARPYMSPDLNPFPGPAVCKKNIFHLFRSTRPVKNHT